MRALLAIALLAACAPLTRYNVAVTAEAGLPLRLGDVDRAIEQLDIAFASAGLLELGHTEQVIASKWLSLEWRKGDHFACDLRPDKKLAYGCEDGVSIEVAYRGCIGSSALTHEFAHIVMGAVRPPLPVIRYGIPANIPDEDPDHEQVEWWSAQGKADEILRKTCEGT